MIPSPAAASPADASSGNPGAVRCRSARATRPSALQFVGVAFLVAQLALVMAVRFTATIPVQLTPLEGHSRYHMHVTIGERLLTPAEIRRRYRIAARDRVELTPAALQAVVRHRESVAADAGDQVVSVRLHFRRNDGAEEVWLWPES